MHLRCTFPGHNGPTCGGRLSCFVMLVCDFNTYPMIVDTVEVCKPLC